ncbi:MAG TPA: hypothetical protein VF153_04030, partial [Candidatus Limnocylindria bacterium]
MVVREQLGLRADQAWLTQVAADPKAETRTLGIPLSADEAADIQQRFDPTLEPAEVVRSYGDEHRESFAGVYIDRQHGNRVVALFTADVAAHQAALDA